MIGSGLDSGGAANDDAIVFVVDDDDSVRRSTERLVRPLGFGIQTFASAREFLDGARLDRPACLVLDVHMPGLSGLDLQSELAQRGVEIPIVFLTGHGDIPMTVRAMKAGAWEFLQKPFGDQMLLEAVEQAVARSRDALGGAREAEAARERYSTLTPKEREVMSWVVTGLLNKQIGARLGISESTIKAHRGRVMQKMRAGSVADLVRLAARLNLRVPPA
jgi:FixJ family two-component response regulator